MGSPALFMVCWCNVSVFLIHFIKNIHRLKTGNASKLLKMPIIQFRYSTLFTMPYILVANYHETNTVSNCINILNSRPSIYCLITRTDPKMTLKRYLSITFQYSEGGAPSEESQVRGIGTDVGIVSCMVFLAQFILSLSMVCNLYSFKTR